MSLDWQDSKVSVTDHGSVQVGSEVLVSTIILKLCGSVYFLVCFYLFASCFVVSTIVLNGSVSFPSFLSSL